MLFQETISNDSTNSNDDEESDQETGEEDSEYVDSENEFREEIPEQVRAKSFINNDEDERELKVHFDRKIDI